MIKSIFSLAWLAQLAIGFVLFTLSCWIEIQVLQHFIDNNLLAITLAIALELGKALAIFWNRFLLLEGSP